MLKGYLKLILFFSLLLSIFGVHSQSFLPDTIDLESVSVVGNKYSIGSRTGIKIITIDSLIIREKTGLSLSELLQENSPIFIKTYGRGATATASFRGTAASHTNVYWNGIKINSPMSGEADFSLIPIYFIDNISIHFGQSSMKYGSGGLGGSVNLLSTPSWTDKLSVKLYQSVGSFNTYSSALKASYGKGKAKAQTRVFRELSQNNFPYQNIAKINKPIEIQQNADYHKLGLLQEIYIRPKANNILSTKVWLQETSRGIPQLMSSYSVNDRNRQKDQTINAIVDWKSNGNTSWGISSSLSFFNLNYEYSKKSTEGNSLPVIDVESRSWSWNTKTSLQKDIFNWLNTEFQAEINTYWVNSQEHILNSGYAKNQTHTVFRTTITAVPTSNLNIALFIGEDIYDGKATPVSSSLFAEFNILRDKSLTAKGGVSRNYHHPSLNDLYWQPGGNLDLKPEDGLTFEGGLSYSLSQQSTKSSLDLTIFTSKIANWIMWLPHLKGYWEPINLNLVKTKGVELSLKTRHKVGQTQFLAIGTYGYTRSIVENAAGVLRPEVFGKQLPFIPIHSGGISVNAIWRKFHFVYSFTHYSERFTTTSNNPNSIRRLYPYYMSSIALGKDLTISQSAIGVQLRIDNLLNESYQTILWRPMPGRNYSLVVRFEL